MNYPTNMDDVIDSRDVIEAISEIREELRIDYDAYRTEWKRTHSQPIGFAMTYEQWTQSAVECDQELYRTLGQLMALQRHAEDYSEDWQYGATLIRNSYFEQYAEELADDIGAINRKAMWPLNHIDWEQAARELQMDYTSVVFDGVIYWVR